jgi:LPPG:FO 2-phospho-L-lactate transferase
VNDARWLLLSGGVGGAKLALGLAHCLPAGQLTVLANTGDDFEHLGLVISPDLDTLMYTLAGVVNTQTGWGRAGETWSFMEALGQLGGETWFRLGDHDLATHVERTRRLAAGEPLSAVTAALCARLGVGSTLLPMSDDPVRTLVHTDAGVLAFQDYFVRRAAGPRVQRLEYRGAAAARPAAALAEVLADPALAGILIAPSNPWLSIAPILAVPGLAAALRACPAPVVAISPLIGARAVKGPTARIMADLGLPVGAAGIAAHYHELLDGFILDRADAAVAAAIAATGLKVQLADSLMTTLEDRIGLARAAMDFAAALRRD